MCDDFVVLVTFFSSYGPLAKIPLQIFAQEVCFKQYFNSLIAAVYNKRFADEAKKSQK